MVELDLIQWIDQHIVEVTSPESADGFLADLATKCLAEAMLAFTTSQHEGKIRKSELEKDGNDLMLLPVIKQMDDYWRYGVTHIKERYEITLYRFADLIMVVLMTKGSPDDPVFSDALNRAAVAYADTMSHSDHKIDQVKNQEMLSEFLKLFEEIKVYYPEREMYDSEDDAQKFERMNEIYNTLITGTP